VVYVEHFRSEYPSSDATGPDGLVACGDIDDYAAGHPTPAAVGLVIEVADASLEKVRGNKLRSYARAGIICYWIVNLIDRQVEVDTQRLPLVLDGKFIAELAAADLLPAVT
jgi:hypothetical protein